MSTMIYALKHSSCGPEYTFHSNAVDIDGLLDNLFDQNVPPSANSVATKSLDRKLLDRSITNSHGKSDCSICIFDMNTGDQIICLGCKHCFHEVCITTWLVEKDTCPYCRQKVVARES